MEMVVSTDLGTHGDTLGRFKRRLLEQMDFSQRDDVRLTLCMILKFADFSFCARTLGTYTLWANRLQEEYATQWGDAGSIRPAVSPLMDRQPMSAARTQLSMLNYVALPLFGALSDMFPALRFSGLAAQNNKSAWTGAQT